MRPLPDRRPYVSVVVIVHDMAREAPRTLYSLSTAYQRHIEPDDYEVIVVDNGSIPPFNIDVIKRLSGNFRVIRLDPAPPSPAHAVNVGIAAARGEIVGVMIDGARIVTPGLVHFSAHGVRLYQNAVVTTLGWYLGYDYQPWSILAGHDQAHEDTLLDSSKWWRDGYTLFDIATMDGPSEDGWFAPLNESGALFLSREAWELLGGMDERFDLPGGGLVNLDTFCRALELPDAQLVILLGEGTFHQAHGGIASGTPAPRFHRTAEGWFKQYETLRGRELPQPRLDVPRTYLGALPRPPLARFVRSVMKPLPRHPEPPLGANFDFHLWSPEPLASPADHGIAQAIDLAYRELDAGRGSTAVAIARLVRARSPREPAVQRLLATNAGWRRYDEVIGPLVEHNLALAEACEHLGDDDSASAYFREALRHDGDLLRAHAGLARLRLPGDDDMTWLARLYTSRAAATVVELGKGDLLSQIKPPTRAIWIEPGPVEPNIPTAETHYFPEPSETFFARQKLGSLLDGECLDMALIDHGPRLYERALDDLSNLERKCGPRSMILLRGTIPLDDITQRREKTTSFHTGDVWKIVLCLKHYRPDLDIFTIATPPAGLTVVTALDPTSDVLQCRFDEAVARFIDLSYTEWESRLGDELNIVRNHWPAIEHRLKASGVI